MKPTKTKNGKYRIKVYDYQDAEGKQHYKSFTHESKDECLRMALEFKENRDLMSGNNLDMTVKDAVELYIKERENIVAPSTLVKYRFMQKNLGTLDHIRLKDLNNHVLQVYINEISKTLSPKSVKDRNGFLMGVFGSFCPSKRFKVKLPKKIKQERYLPSDDEIKVCVDNAGTYEMKLAISLGAFCMMRAGEICAFTKKDLNGNTLHISKTMSKTEGGYAIKSPKSYKGDRYIDIPEFVSMMIRNMPDDTIGLNPNKITNRFARLHKKLGIKHFRFHDLRHYCCSTFHDLGINNAIIMDYGGWEDEAILIDIYRHAKDSSAKREIEKANNFFVEMNKS